MPRLLFVLMVGLSSPASGESYVVVAEVYPPYEYVEGGQPAGLDFEMLELAAKRAGVTLRYEFVPWARALAQVRQGSADGIFSLRRSAERAGFLWFASINLNTAHAMLYSHPDYKGDPATLAELESEPVGWTMGNYYGTVFDAATVVRVPAPDHQTLMKHLASGQLRVAVFDERVARYWMRKLGITNVRPLRLDLGPGELTMGFSKTAARGRELFDRLEPALAALEADGTFEKIRSRAGE